MTPLHTSRGSRAAFTLIELVVVMLIVSILAGVVSPRVSQYQRSARDSRRMNDLRVVQAAIEQYKLDKGVYPPAKKNRKYGGWDVSHDGNFIPTLVEQGYLAAPVDDPVGDRRYHLRYYVYKQGYRGCVGPSSFYVLGIRNFETQAARDAHVGYWKCKKRDWSREFSYVTGGGASFK